MNRSSRGYISRTSRIFKQRIEIGPSEFQFQQEYHFARTIESVGFNGRLSTDWNIFRALDVRRGPPVKMAMTTRARAFQAIRYVEADGKIEIDM